MESTGKGNSIQVSNTTARELRNLGRKKWLTRRDDKVFCKGKGDMETYWLQTLEEASNKKNQKYSGSQAASDSGGMDMDLEDMEFSENNGESMTKMERLVEWNVQQLSFLLCQILVARKGGGIGPLGGNNIKKSTGAVDIAEKAFLDREVGPETATVLSEFQEIITLPTISDAELRKRKDPSTVKLPPVVVAQLRELITNIALLYNEHSFHNFEHATHVTASVRKLLTRIVDADHGSGGHQTELVTEAGHSYGITSDPLTQFAVVFSAVIHDVGKYCCCCVCACVHIFYDFYLTPNFVEFRLGCITYIYYRPSRCT